MNKTDVEYQELMVKVGEQVEPAMIKENGEALPFLLIVSNNHFTSAISNSDIEIIKERYNQLSGTPNKLEYQRDKDTGKIYTPGEKH